MIGIGPRLAPTRRSTPVASRRGRPAARCRDRGARTSTRSWPATRSGLFDTIGHLDFVKRYLVPVRDRRPSSRPRPELYEPLLRALVETGTALEVNTQRAAPGAPRETYPAAPIVARYPGARGHRVVGRLRRPPGGIVRLRPEAGVRGRRRRRVRGGLPFRRGGERARRPCRRFRPRARSSLRAHLTRAWASSL